MTITLFIALLVVLATVVSLITQAVKSFLDSDGVDYSSNVVVLIVSAIAGLAGIAITYIFMDIPFTLPNVICLLLMPVTVWVGAMVGYDKVIQMINQLNTI